MVDSSKLEVIFVDDEPNVLAGLRRSMMSMRTHWNTRFAGGAEEALALLTQQPADVVVSDLRMPGIDGIRLLEQVEKSYPQAVRVILSGNSDRDSLYRALGCAHQYLTKPCNPEGLKSVIEQVRDSLVNQDSEVIRRVVACVDSLPQLPETYRRLLEALQESEIGIRDVAAIVSGDLAASTHVLRLVNSALFSLTRTITDIESAVVLLGIDTIKAIVLSHGLFEQSSLAAPWLDVRQIRDHSHAVAAMARWIGEVDGATPGELANLFTASTVHDVGLLVMAATPASTPAGPTQLDPPDRDWENSTFGANRYTVGAYLLTMWGFAPDVIDAIGRLDGPVPSDVGPAWRLRAAHELVLQFRLTAVKVPGRGEPAPEDLLQALKAIRPPEIEAGR